MHEPEENTALTLTLQYKKRLFVSYSSCRYLMDFAWLPIYVNYFGVKVEENYICLKDIDSNSVYGFQYLLMPACSRPAGSTSMQHVRTHVPFHCRHKQVKSILVMRDISLIFFLLDDRNGRLPPNVKIIVYRNTKSARWWVEFPYFDIRENRKILLL